jgi:uncharacterized lipoprotein YehR (DUF1307 family)
MEVKNMKILEKTKKRMVSVLLVALMTISMAACGSETSTTSNEATIDGSTSSGSDTVASIENSNSNETQDVVAVEETSKAEEETKEYTYEENNNCFMIPSTEFVYEGEYFMDYQSLDPQENQIEFVDVDDWPTYGIYDSINLYAGTGQVKGYTKENAICQLCATSEEGWGVIIIDGRTIYIKMEDFEGNSVLVTDMDGSGNYIIPERGSTTTSNETTSTNSNTTSSETTTSKETNTSSNTTNETSSNISNSTPVANEVETQVIEVDDKYTPEEAVAVWRGILEANGMTWDPSIKDWASWGTGWLELKKGKPEEAAQMDLKGYAYGDGAGNSSTRYYIEVTGYDDNKVYMTRWSV